MRRVTEPDERIREIRRNNAKTRVPTPEPTAASRQRPPLWIWPTLVVLTLGLVVAAIRGDEPTTVAVSDGSISPTEESSEQTTAPDDSYGPIDPTTGDQLEVCEWDYCIVHEHIGEARIEQFIYLIDLDEANAIANSVIRDLDLEAVSVTSESLTGNLGGFYEPSDASITLDEPIVTWAVIHELAHHVVWERFGLEAQAHGDEFLDTLDALTETR